MSAPTEGWVVGIDLSLASTALAAMHTRTGELFLHRVRSTGKTTDTLAMKVARYRTLASDITAAALACAPVAVAIEMSLINISEPTRREWLTRKPYSA